MPVSLTLIFQRLLLSKCVSCDVITTCPVGVNLMALLTNMKQVFRLSPGFKASQTFDLSFDLSISDMFFTWSNGGTLCVLPELELSCPAEYIVREKIDFWHSVPTLVEFLKKLGKKLELIFLSKKLKVKL